MTIRLLQDATGGRTVTFDSNCIFTGLQQINTAPNAYTVIRAYFDRAINKVALTILNSQYLGAFTTTAKNALTGVTAGAQVFDTNLGIISVYNGSTWSTGAGTGPSLTTSNTYTGSPNTFQVPNLTTSPTDALYVQNPTVSTASLPNQYSPGFHFGGHVWNTTATATDNYVDWRVYADAVSGTTPTTNFHIQSSVNTSSTPTYADAMLLSKGGAVTFPSYSGYNAPAYFNSSGLLKTNGNFLFDDTHYWLGLGTGGAAPGGNLDLGSSVSSSNWQIKAGAFFVQSQSTNNMTVGNNFYYSGGLTRPTSGYASGFQFYNGQILFLGANSGSGTFSAYYGMKYDGTNNYVSIGGSNTASPGSTTGATIVVTPTNVILQAVPSASSGTLVGLSRNTNGNIETFTLPISSYHNHHNR